MRVVVVGRSTVRTAKSVCMIENVLEGSDSRGGRGLRR